jgi:uncharacterized protein
MRNLILLFIFVFPALVSANSYPIKPAYNHYYVDEALIIDADDAEVIDAIATTILDEQKVPIYVVTIPSLAKYDSYTIEDFATRLFNHWGIGFQENNYGALLVVSVADRKARIELGADWGHRFDYDAERIMNQLIIPAFKRGDYSTGIVDGVNGIDSMIRGLGLPKATPPWWVFPFKLFLTLFAILFIRNIYKKGDEGWAINLLIMLLSLAGTLLLAFFASGGSGGGSGGGYSGGSSGGFGGGSSGGGGATGSW